MKEMLLIPEIADKMQRIAKHNNFFISGETPLRVAAKTLQELYPDLVYNPMTTTIAEYSNSLDVVINRENIT